MMMSFWLWLLTSGGSGTRGEGQRVCESVCVCGSNTGYEHLRVLLRLLFRWEWITSHPAVTGQQDGVALDVAVDDALCVQIGQSPQHRQTHRGDLLLVHPVGRHTHNISNDCDGKLLKIEGLYVNY